MADIERLLGDVITRHRGADETWRGLSDIERAMMLAYVARGWLLNPRRHRAEEIAFWLSFGRQGADRWLHGKTALSTDYARWLPEQRAAQDHPGALSRGWRRPQVQQQQRS
jgi:hypothetical protein